MGVPARWGVVPATWRAVSGAGAAKARGAGSRFPGRVPVVGDPVRAGAGQGTGGLWRRAGRDTR
ncbi:hypothetical protein ACFO0F_33245 [Nonomuraea zeae]|uniref:hypothetical protein n=1 Tax=Nonomuraea zeae TaxID=1642303 RepID=UPI003613959B